MIDIFLSQVAYSIPLTRGERCYDCRLKRISQKAQGERTKMNIMKERRLTIPEIMLIGGTRVALGAGIGLLLAERLSDDQRRGAGWALLAVGALSTIPLVMNVLGKKELN
jgi:hypothetical protein